MNLLPLLFTKMSGAGNTFIVVNTEDIAWNDFERQIRIPRSEFAKLICGATHGLGADGFLILSRGDQNIDYIWDFYNSDGSTAEMCGNAARCATRYCYEILENQSRSHFRFMTGAGLVEANMLGSDEVRVQMPKAEWMQKEIFLKLSGGDEENFALVNTGVPHLVKKLPNFTESAALKKQAAEARAHKELGPKGANVTYYAVDSDEKIKAVTFERGVENYTLACGTGAVAAAMVHYAKSGKSPMEVIMPGGHLSVTFLAEDKRPLLEGDAVFIGEFKYSLEVFR